MHGTSSRRGRAAFTMVEMLTVIAIIMVVMALALPNFAAMMKERRWSGAIGNIQGMVWRARALATNARKDMSVEFDIQGDNGTWMWLESKSNLIEHLPDLNWLVSEYGSIDSLYFLLNEDTHGEWWAAGGTYSGSSPTYTFTLHPENAKPEFYGHAAHQSETLELGYSLTIDDSPARSPNFVNWDAQASVTRYGWDTTKDIRLGPSGALVQTTDPTLCIRQKQGVESRRVQVVRCTGRVIPAQ
jgi:type II secretory pathway pseudopilin PulG